jgi:hypothetical protein
MVADFIVFAVDTDICEHSTIFVKMVKGMRVVHYTVVYAEGFSGDSMEYAEGFGGNSVTYEQSHILAGFG